MRPTKSHRRILRQTLVALGLLFVINPRVATDIELPIVGYPPEGNLVHKCVLKLRGSEQIVLSTNIREVTLLKHAGDWWSPFAPPAYAATTLSRRYYSLVPPCRERVPAPKPEVPGNQF